jgi:predicted phage terminase large subunit-like protein
MSFPMELADADVPRLVHAIERARAAGDDDVVTLLAGELDKRLRFQPLPHQQAPTGDWATHLLLGGRGSGKTATCSYRIDQHALGPPCDPSLPGGHRMGIIGPTFGDTVDSCFYSPAGLSRINPDVHLKTLRGGITVVEWPNGAVARIFGAYTEQDTERLRAGGNRCFDWWEELAAWREIQKGYDQAIFGLRLGPNPRAIASTTPKNRPLIHALVDASEEYRETGTAALRRDRIVVTGATTDDNPHLDAEVRADLYARYANTRLGDQELLGLLLADLGARYVRADFGVSEEAPEWPIRLRSWDLAGTEPSPANEDPDWTAGARLSFETNSLGLVNIDDIVHVRKGPAEVERTVLATADLDGPETIVLIEQEPGQSGKAQVEHYRRLLRGKVRRVEGILPSGDKEVRSQLPEAAVQQHRVSLTRAGWNLGFLDEAEAFPEGAHDDQIDAVSQGFAWMEGRRAAGPAKASTVANRRLTVALR